MPPIPVALCQSCEFYRDGRCHRYPPVAVPRAGTYVLRADERAVTYLSPIVPGTGEACGEYKKGEALNALDHARRFIYVRERAGSKDNPYVVAWLEDAGIADAHDEIAWCGAFARFIIGRVLGLPVPARPARARSWLLAGRPIELDDAQPGDIIVFSRGGAEVQPGPEVLDAPGHVAFFVSATADSVRVLGGNQGNQVCEQVLPRSRFLGARRLTENP
jgi:uncharacterized protein (TIGR02594 family)